MIYLHKILQHLLQNKVEFVLVGGLAAAAYGSSMITRDLDACFDFRPGNVEKLLKALEPLHPRVRAGKSDVALSECGIERLSQLGNLYVKTDLGEVDLLGQIAGIGSYSDVRSHSKELEIFGLPCRILDIDSLIKAKETMDRPKDKQVVLELQLIRKKLNKI